jgi:uncharacterized phiE125 gp8 family phage protein
MSLRHSPSLYQYRGHVRLTGPDSEPVSLSSVKAALVIDGTQDDEILSEYIATAREYIETMTGMTMVLQTWRLSLDCWPNAREQWWDGWREGARSELYAGATEVILPSFPLASVDTVTVYDEDGSPAVVDIAATFDIDTYQKPGRMVLKRGAVWPIALRAANAIQIDYTAGYAPNAMQTPAPLRSAVRQMAAYLYSHRGDGCDVGDAYTMSGAEALARAYSVAGI